MYVPIEEGEKADSFDFLISNFSICTGHVIAHVAYILFVIHFWWSIVVVVFFLVFFFFGIFEKNLLSPTNEILLSKYP